jgi:hypothetical protein
MGKNRVCYFYDGTNCLPLHYTLKFAYVLQTVSLFLASITAEVRTAADEVSGLHYGPKHPMKPHRITMTHHLVVAYDLHNHFDMYVRTSSLKTVRHSFSFGADIHPQNIHYAGARCRSHENWARSSFTRFIPRYDSLTLQRWGTSACRQSRVHAGVHRLPGQL